MNKDKNSLQISKSYNKENESYDDKEINIEKKFNEKDSCEGEEQINIQSQIIDTLKARLENLETDFGVRDQNIKKLQQKFKLARLCAVNERQVVNRFYGPQISLATQNIKNCISSNKLKSKEVEGYNDNALSGAYMINDLNYIKYPPGIKPPDPTLNYCAEPGKFRYDRGFMMQFMSVCTERPKNLDYIFPVNQDDPGNSTRRKKNRQAKSQTIEEKILSPTTDVSSSDDILTSLSKIHHLEKGKRKEIFEKTELDYLDNTISKGEVQEPNVIPEKVTPIERLEEPKPTENIIPTHIVIRDIRELLRKLTFEEFDSISGQIIEYANRSRDEKDGRILRELNHLIIERLKPQEICAVYARLCREIIERIDPRIVDENVRNPEGKFIQGGALFRKYLLNSCQDNFEKGWEIPSNEKDESNPTSNTVKSRKKAKRRGLGLVCFISELFKLNMVTERIMHECIRKLLVFKGLPGEEEMEVLCKLMITIGEELDHLKTNKLEQTKLEYNAAKQLMDSHFTTMMKITKLPNLPARIKSMLMSTIDLRNNAWKPLYSPKIEDAAKQKKDAESSKTSRPDKRGMPKLVSPKGSSSHEDKEMTYQESSASLGDDGWNVVGKNSSPPKKIDKDKAGDLTKFGSVGRIKISGKVNLIPGGTFGVLSKGAKGWTK